MRRAFGAVLQRGLLLLAVFCVSCGSSGSSNAGTAAGREVRLVAADTQTVGTQGGGTPPVQSNTGLRPQWPWADSLVMRYINAPVAFKNHVLPGANVWLWDSFQERDSVVFLMAQLGSDASGRFATCGWLYLDTAQRRLYEYDLPNDTLVPWP